MLAATAEVMGSTARLAEGGDFRRRLLETATGFAGALDVEGTMPGGQRRTHCVRMYLLHNMIRLVIRRGGRWPRDDTGTPINTLPYMKTPHSWRT